MGARASMRTRRAIRVAVGVVAAAAVVASCSSHGSADRPTTATSHPSSAGSKRTPVRVEGDVLIRETSESDPAPIACDYASGTGQSGPCVGVPVAGLDWASAPRLISLGAESVKAALLHVVGSYDGDTLTLTQAGASIPAAGQTYHEPGCGEPTGGWASQRGAAITLEQLWALQRELAARPEVVATWMWPFEEFVDVSDTGSSPTVSPTIDWPLTAHSVLTVLVENNESEYESEIAAHWNGPICVVKGTRPSITVDEAQAILTSPKAVAAGVELVSVARSTEPDIPIDVMWVRLAVLDEDTRAWIGNHLGGLANGIGIEVLFEQVS